MDDLKRMREIRRARHARYEAADLRILGHPVLEVLLLLLERPRLVRDLVADDHARPGGHGTDRAQVGVAGARRMVLDVPVRRTDRLPDPVQVGTAFQLCGKLSVCAAAGVTASPTPSRTATPAVSNRRRRSVIE